MGDRFDYEVSVTDFSVCGCCHQRAESSIWFGKPGQTIVDICFRCAKKLRLTLIDAEAALQTAIEDGP